MLTPVRKRRLLKELTLDDLSCRTNIGVPKLSRLERNLLKPTPRERELISKALEVDEGALSYYLTMLLDDELFNKEEEETEISYVEEDCVKIDWM